MVEIIDIAFFFFFFFFFNDTATTEIYTLSLHDALPISKAFLGLQALSDVSFDVRAGEILGIIGPNGAGKTTLFNVLNGFLLPERGDVRWLGQSITGLPPHVVCRRGVGRTFQVVRLFPHLTVLENVMV